MRELERNVHLSDTQWRLGAALEHLHESLAYRISYRVPASRRFIDDQPMPEVHRANDAPSIAARQSQLIYARVIAVGADKRRAF